MVFDDCEYLGYDQALAYDLWCHYMFEKRSSLTRDRINRGVHKDNHLRVTTRDELRALLRECVVTTPQSLAKSFTSFHHWPDKKGNEGTARKYLLLVNFIDSTGVEDKYRLSDKVIDSFESELDLVNFLFSGAHQDRCATVFHHREYYNYPGWHGYYEEESHKGYTDYWNYIRIEELIDWDTVYTHTLPYGKSIKSIKKIMSHASHLFFNFEKDKKIKINCNDILKENQKKDFSGMEYSLKTGLLNAYRKAMIPYLSKYATKTDGVDIFPKIKYREDIEGAANDMLITKDMLAAQYAWLLKQNYVSAEEISANVNCAGEYLNAILKYNPTIPLKKARVAYNKVYYKLDTDFSKFKSTMDVYNFIVKSGKFDNLNTRQTERDKNRVVKTNTCDPKPKMQDDTGSVEWHLEVDDFFNSEKLPYQSNSEIKIEK